MARWMTAEWCAGLAGIALVCGQMGAAAAAGTASIKGAVRFEGTPPPAKTVTMGADPNCKASHPDGATIEEVAVNSDGTLRHVFVYVKEGLAGQTFAPPAEPTVLTQHGCLYEPHVVGVQVGQPLEVRNSDPTIHNVRATATQNQPFNFAQPKQDMRTTKMFDKPEVMIKLGCNIHPWMRGYVGVVAHPFFAITGVDGSFTLSGLPAGTYTIEAWHELYGTQTQTVTVADHEEQALAFTYQSP